MLASSLEIMKSQPKKLVNSTVKHVLVCCSHSKLLIPKFCGVITKNSLDSFQKSDQLLISEHPYTANPKHTYGTKDYTYCG